MGPFLLGSLLRLCPQLLDGYWKFASFLFCFCLWRRNTFSYWFKPRIRIVRNSLRSFGIVMGWFWRPFACKWLLLYGRNHFNLSYPLHFWCIMLYTFYSFHYYYSQLLSLEGYLDYLGFLFYECYIKLVYHLYHSLWNSFNSLSTFSILNGDQW